MDTYYLGTKVTVVLGAAGGDDFIATADTLVTGDVIRGSNGTNTLTLQGAGTFNLNAFWQIVNVQFLDVQEGAGQTVYLRNGVDLEVDAASPDPSDPGAGITIYGARNADVIKLGGGNDTVYLGDARESVVGGGGNDAIYVSAATIGATIDGGTGPTTLHVTGGGTATMGANITDIAQVVLEAAPAGQTQPDYVFTANSIRGLTIIASAGNDTIIVGDGSQSIIAGPGQDLIEVTAATAGAQVTGTGTTTVEVLGGGTATLNGATSDVTVTLQQATDLTLSTVAGITAIGSSGADTITALAPGQVLISVSGEDTLIGAAQGGDTFEGTAGGLSGDTIENFAAPGDAIDATNIAFGAATTVGYAGTAAGGKLTVTDGTHSALINLTGLFAPGGFYLAADGTSTNGTLVTYSVPQIATTITAGLSHYTGVSPGAGITSDPAIGGTVTSAFPIVTFTASLDNGPNVDVLAELQPDGSFALDDAEMRTIAGGTLADGAHSLKLTATDQGSQTASLTIGFTLETAPPVLTAALTVNTTATPGVTSDPAIAGTITDPAGIAAFTASLDGQSAVNELAQLAANGRFQLSAAQVQALAGGTLGDGNHTLVFSATDTAGNIATQQIGFTLVPGADFHWQGTSATNPSGDWSDAADWIGGLVPPPSANAIIDATAPANALYTVTSAESNTVNSIITVASATLAVTGGTFTTTNGTGTGANAGIISVGDGASTNLGGAITNIGTVEAMGGGTLVISGNMDNSGSVLADGGSVYLDGSVINTATIEAMNGGKVYIDGTVDSSVIAADASSLVIVGTGGTVDGDGTISGPLQNDGVVNADGGTLFVAGPVTGSGSAAIEFWGYSRTRRCVLRTSGVRWGCAAAR